MPAVIQNAPTPEAFANAWVDEVLTPAFLAAAGRDRKLSERDALNAAEVEEGPLALTGDVLEELRRLTGQTKPSLTAIKNQGRIYAEHHAGEVAGRGNTVSFAEAEHMPSALAGGYLVLRGRVPPQPAPDPIPDPDPPPGPDGLGVISDIDLTVMPAEHGGELPAPYPGVAALFRELERQKDRHDDATWYVTARKPERVANVPAWLVEHDMPNTGIETGLGGQPWIVEPEKVRDILALFDAHPDRKFILFGDTSARDPEVFRRILAERPNQVSACVVHKTTGNRTAARLEGMIGAENYAVAAAELYHAGVLSKSAARRVISAARAQGLDLTRAAGDALLQDR